MEVTELRKKLVERLRKQVSLVHGEHHDDALEKLVLISRSIEAIDFVMKADGPLEPDQPSAFFVG